MVRRQDPEAQPQIPSLDGDSQYPERRLSLDAFRAFGSIPNLLGAKQHTHELVDFDALTQERSDPSVLERGLFGVDKGSSHNGLALPAKYYETIVRSPEAFEASIRGRTVQANRQASDPRASEKAAKSVIGALESKTIRHSSLLDVFQKRADELEVLTDMQRTPGFHRRVTEMDVRIIATNAWNGVFEDMFIAIHDAHEVPIQDMDNVRDAVASRLLSGAQRDRMAQWGQMLNLASKYNRATQAIFQGSFNCVESSLTRQREQLGVLYDQYDINPIGRAALGRTIEE